MGPQHPSTHGVLRVVLKLDGERVKDVECVIGYLHRGVEKIAENRTYGMFVPYVDRMDYVAAVSNGLGFCLAVEKLVSAEAPARAQAVRVILTELNRIASHLLWLGTHALDIGAMSPLFYTFRDREEILKIFENYCGARLTTHAFRIGGLLYELYDGFEEQVRAFCEYVKPKFDDYEQLLSKTDLDRPPTQCGCAECGRLQTVRRHGAGAACLGREMGPSQSAALFGLRTIRLRDTHAREWRQL